MVGLAVTGIVVLGTTTLLAQVVGPARRAAAGTDNAVGAPGVEDRMERREERRDVRRSDVNPNAAARANAREDNPDRWRMRYYNSQWWYYTPKNQWMYYSDDSWQNYDPNSYAPPRRITGYRGYTGVYGPPPFPVNPDTRAGNAGANLGAGIGGAINGPQGADRGANLGGAIGGAIDASKDLNRTPPPTSSNVTPWVPNNSPQAPAAPAKPAPEQGQKERDKK